MHHKIRHISKIINKRAKMFPAIGLLGPRQVGKSTFLIKEWVKEKNAVYLTFDKLEIAMRAKRSPEQLLTDESNHLKTHLIIDEAQKVPHIFDSIKALIDQNRKLGAFTLSGSVEFSSKAGIRESLAGRIGITRLYPMTMRELNNQNFYAPWITLNFSSKNSLKPNSVERWLERGGMPIFCCFSDLSERMGVINSWLEAICYRDLHLIKEGSYDGEVAIQLLRIIALNASSPISFKEFHDLGVSSASIKKYLSALESLFLLYRIPSFENPRAQPMYKVFDSGVVNVLLGGQETIKSRHQCLVTLLINEIYAQYEYSGKAKPSLYYYRTRGGAEIDLVLKTNDQLIGIECSTSVDISPYKLRGMESFLKKHEEAVGYIIAPIQKAYKASEKIFVIPWDAIG
jgi:predicted AAA+ superfamily ATPase